MLSFERGVEVVLDLYSFSLVVGAAGLGAMALGGVGRHGSAARGAHSHLAHGRLAPRRATPHHAPHQAPHGAAREPGLRAFWSLLSPRVLFSVMVGFGAAGMLLRPTLSGLAQVAAAAAGGIAFEVLLVRPLWNLAFRFASTPALTLESCIGDRVNAVTGFDGKGHGVVALELDGQVVQLLGTLRPEDRRAGVRVRAGDELYVEDVDAHRNRCTVSPVRA